MAARDSDSKMYPMKSAGNPVLDPIRTKYKENKQVA
jgi:hypothetical protein